MKDKYLISVKISGSTLPYSVVVETPKGVMFTKNQIRMQLIYEALVGYDKNPMEDNLVIKGNLEKLSFAILSAIDITDGAYLSEEEGF